MTDRKPKTRLPAIVVCVNCGDEVHGRAGSRGRGPDIAWYAHCGRCAALVIERERRAPPSTAGAHRGGPLPLPKLWLSPDRSHQLAHPGACLLDERSAGHALASGERLLARPLHEPDLADQVRRFAGLTSMDVVAGVRPPPSSKPRSLLAWSLTGIAVMAGATSREQRTDCRGAADGLVPGPMAPGAFTTDVDPGSGSVTGPVRGVPQNLATARSPPCRTAHTCFTWSGIEAC